MKGSARAHPIQGLVKYHGLKDPALNIPYHDSISVCAGTLNTTTTVEFLRDLGEDQLIINRRPALPREKERASKVLDVLRRKAGCALCAQVTSENSLTGGKGLGFSASAFAALGLAATKALGLSLNPQTLSEAVRLGAGSATRSLVGDFSIWYADEGGRSYGERLPSPEETDFRMVIVPLPSDAKTEEAHREVVTSPLFEGRLKYLPSLIDRMRRAVERGDVKAIGEGAEMDTLNLHAVTMAGASGLLLMKPESLRVVEEVRMMRGEGVGAWFSLDTGPSVFINTTHRWAGEIQRRISSLGLPTLISPVGGGAEVI